jgi:hypothetical protein
VKSVESLRVESVEMLHHPGKISLGRAQTNMIVLCEVLNYVKFSASRL